MTYVITVDSAFMLKILLMLLITAWFLAPFWLKLDSKWVNVKGSKKKYTYIWASLPLSLFLLSLALISILLTSILNALLSLADKLKPYLGW